MRFFHRGSIDTIFESVRGERGASYVGRPRFDTATEDVGDEGVEVGVVDEEMAEDELDEFEDAHHDDMSFKSAYDGGLDYDLDSPLASEDDYSHSGAEGPLSTFDPSLIGRISVQIKALRILSGLGDHFEGNETTQHDDQEYNDDHGDHGGTKLPYQELVSILSTSHMNPIEDRGPVYSHASTGINKSQFASFTWSELTKKGPVELEVVIDYDPHKRIMLSDFVESNCDSPPLELQVAQSQFYLLLSLWYDNMQELPIMFPLTEDEMREYTAQVDAPDDWPEYGTKAWVKRVTR